MARLQKSAVRRARWAWCLAASPVELRAEAIPRGEGRVGKLGRLLGSWGKEWRPRGCRVEEGEEEEESIGVDDDDDGGTSCLSPSWPWPWLVVAVPSPRGMVCAAYRLIERVKEREKKRERKRE